MFIGLLTTLNEIEHSPILTADARLAIGLKEGLCKFETILTAVIYLCVFQNTTPLSKFLQGDRVNIMTSYKIIMVTLDYLKEIRRDFLIGKEAADLFVSWANEQL